MDRATDCRCASPLETHSRRGWIQLAAMALGTGVSGALGLRAAAQQDPPKASQCPPINRISLAQWSLHRAIGTGALDPMDFPLVAKRDYGIAGVEYVNSFYRSRIGDVAALGKELSTRCGDAGVTSVLIMCDGEGDLGNPESAERAKAVQNHVRWLDLAAILGCHSIRVNAKSAGSAEEQAKLAADGLRSLAELAEPKKLNVIVENHGGLSSHGDWLAGVIRSVGLPNCGTLPDFGNFYEYHRYQGVRDLMPWAKGVSAKSYDFAPDSGAETTIDFAAMLKIVRDAQYAGWIGIEYEGGRLSEPDGIRATRDLLVKLGCVA